MLAYAMEIAKTNLLYGVVRDVSGHLWPLNGVLWLPNGEANGVNYYTYPRPGASTGDDAWDMLVGTGGWFNTMGWPTLVAVYAQHGPDEQAAQVATEILSSYTARTPALCEWLAV